MLYITLRQYEYILAVADTGSLTDAASVLHVSQPSLSVAITRVEDHLRRKIFLRGKGSAITTTPFGHRFITHARELVSTATTLEYSAETTRPFVLGCFEDIAPWHLPKTLGTLQQEFPNRQFTGKEGRLSDLATGMKQGQIDLAITYDIGFESTFCRRKLKDVVPVAFLATDHPLAGQSVLEMEQLVPHPLILFSEDLSEGHMRRLFDTLGIDPVVAHRTASLELMRSLSAHGAGIGISYSHPPTATSYDGQPLITIPLVTPQARAGLFAIWPKPDQPDPQLEAIIAAIDIQQL
ncbi:LysR family transcriptional regulator [Roseovarius sp. EL26]|uniref:LysR family transcriptional regulator n=1 Tax=Roseovarius sp. EL26 TaxID=2126672 RepID=UPI000EA1CDAB|nr:LysR family transcriptional regulator [Roseovarius sp. EL26]